MVSFGSLAAGLGVGTATEYLKQTFRFGDVSSDGTNLFMSKANLDRIVDTLCKVRGKLYILIFSSSVHIISLQVLL